MSGQVKTLKILVCGDVAGNFRQLFSRVASIQQKAGHFDMLFCCGNFFAVDDKQVSEEWNLVLSGEIKVPVATFVLGPNEASQEKYYPDINGAELSPSITYLGRRGVYRGSSGLSVAYLSGVEAPQPAGGGKGGKNNDKNPLSTSGSSGFSKEDVQMLCESVTAESGFRGVDILLTSQCPAGFDRYATKSPVDEAELKGSELIAQLALAVKPRYHFSSLQNFFYERQPYRNHQILRGEAQHTTRFLCLARHGNPTKQKHLYAFNIQPMREMSLSELIKQPDDVTETPYKPNRALLSNSSTNSATGQEAAQQFFYDADALKSKNVLSKRRHDGGQGHGGKKRPFTGPPPQARGPCWFCLASPEVEKHLVTSIGDHCYLAMAKGGLTPHHTLISTISHYKCSADIPEPVTEEINRYKMALVKCFKERDEDVVFFERNFKTQHLQIQAVPIPHTVSDKVRNCFLAVARQQHIDLKPLQQSQPLNEVISGDADYFYAEVSDRCLLYSLITDRKFPLNFAREALAHRDILDMMDRVNWRDCMTTEEEESDTATQFRNLFKNFDFTL